MKYIALFVFLVGCDWWNPPYPPDNLIEQIDEQIIENEKGIDLDLSPNFPKKKNQARVEVFQSHEMCSYFESASNDYNCFSSEESEAFSLFSSLFSQ